MPKPKKSHNRHPVDRLSDLREQIKRLQEDEKDLRAAIIASGDFVGSEFIAILKESKQNRLDREKLNVKFGKAAVDTCCKEVEVTTLNLFHKVAVAGGGLLD